MQRVLFLFFLLLCIAPATHAVRVPGLYEAEVAVPDQSNSARVQGVVNALRAVIIKLTGDRAAPEHSGVAPVLRAAERYLVQYRYQEVERPAADGGSPAHELRLWAQFGSEALDRDLRGAGLSIWGAERPSTLAWVAIGNENAWRWASGDGGDASLQAAIEARARHRGLGLIFPLQDLDDAARISPAAVAADDLAAVGAASERYAADSVLTGVLDMTAPGTWRARWSLLMGPETQQWTGAAAQLDELLRDGMDGLGDRLARRFAMAGAGAEESGVTLDVVAVDTATGYARVLHYLESLNSVTGVRVGEVYRDKVTFTLSAFGGRDAVRQAIALGRVLEPSGNGADTYRLVQ